MKDRKETRMNPQGWELKSLRHLGRFRKGLTITKADLLDGGIPCLNYGEVHSRYPFQVNQDVQPLRCVDPAYNETNPEAAVNSGDFVFADTSEDFEGVGNFTLVTGISPLFAGYHTIIYSLNSEVNPRFLAYSFDSFPFRTQLRLSVKGIKVFSITQEILRGARVLLPPMDQQQSIAKLLDEESARIDTLIAKKTRLIELLKEKRQAVITKAVTKGLDESVEMKDSGVEWIGAMPEHWNVVQVRHVATLGSGHTPSRSRPDWWQNCYIPWFTLADIWQVRREGRRYIFETKETVSDLGIENSSATVHPAGSVMLSRTASVGFPAIMGCDMATSQDFAVWRCGSRLNNEFLYLVLLGMKQELSRLMIGSTHKTIYMPDIEAFRTPLPSVDEQKAIVQYVNYETSRIDRLTEKTERSIELLKEKRSALITAAVTGKIDVREAA